MTKGGGGLTLASQWKSQFDDSEETDNEWKGENLQSPEHKGINAPSIPPQVKKSLFVVIERLINCERKRNKCGMKMLEHVNFQRVYK